MTAGLEVRRPVLAAAPSAGSTALQCWLRGARHLWTSCTDWRDAAGYRKLADKACSHIGITWGRMRRAWRGPASRCRLSTHTRTSAPQALMVEGPRAAHSIPAATGGVSVTSAPARMASLEAMSPHAASPSSTGGATCCADCITASHLACLNALSAPASREEAWCTMSWSGWQRNSAHSSQSSGESHQCLYLVADDKR